METRYKCVECNKLSGEAEIAFKYDEIIDEKHTVTNYVCNNCQEAVKNRVEE